MTFSYVLFCLTNSSKFKDIHIYSDLTDFWQFFIIFAQETILEQLNQPVILSLLYLYAHVTEKCASKQTVNVTHCPSVCPYSPAFSTWASHGWEAGHGQLLCSGRPADDPDWAELQLRFQGHFHGENPGWVAPLTDIRPSITDMLWERVVFCFQTRLVFFI